MIKDSSDPGSTNFSRRVEIPLEGACCTSHPSYRAAVPSYRSSIESKPIYETSQRYLSKYSNSSGENDGTSKSRAQSTHRRASYYNELPGHISQSKEISLETDYPFSSKYQTSFINATKYSNENSIDKYSLTTKYDESLSKSSYSKRSRSHHSDPNFVQLVPVSSEFPNPDMLPKSMENMSISDQVVNFYPVHKKGRNYLKYCVGWLSDDEKPRSKTDCVVQYTSGSNWYCTEINMALAADSPKLKSYGSYIRQLKYSIGMSPMAFVGTVFRGADMSPSEIQAYETKEIFFVPSFTSTSKSIPFKGKNTLFHIEISPEWSKFCMEIQTQHTKYDEEEILFSCYNLYRYIKTEKSNGQRIIKLQLMNYEKYFDCETNAIFNYYTHKQ